MSKKGEKPKGKGRITAKRVQATENKPVIPTVAVKPETDEGPFDADGLSVRQRAFIDAITGPAGGNASKAAEMAGYASENREALHATASRLLTYAKVQEGIAHALAKRRATPEWAKAALIDLASSSMANFVVVDEKGEATIDFAKAAEAGALGQIKEYHEELIRGGGEQEPAVIKRRIKIHDRTAALGMLLKLFGLLSDKFEHSGAIQLDFDLSKLSDDELAFLREIRVRAAAKPHSN